MAGSCNGVSLAFLEEVEAFEALALALDLVPVEDLDFFVALLAICFTLEFFDVEELGCVCLEVILQFALEHLLDMEVSQN